MKQKSILPTIDNSNIHRSVSYDQDEILNSILDLYCGEFECDLTYSSGNFYRNISEPKFKFDLVPQFKDIVCCNYTDLAIKSNTFNSIMFDPPFLATQPADRPNGKMIIRFGYYKNMEELWNSYYLAIDEIYRILKPNGILVFKCQDTILSAKQYLSHVEIINTCIRTGFYPIDLFILLAKNRIIRTGQEKQYHARKFHSYFLVFKKQKCKVHYKEN